MHDVIVTVLGNATHDPRFTKPGAGAQSLYVRIASNASYFDQDTKTWKDRKTEYFNVYMSKKQAENVLLSVKKGDPLIVTGRLGTSQWTGEDGADSYSQTIQAEAVGLDLTWGAAAFARRSRRDAPAMDVRTGEVLDDSRLAALRAEAGEVPTRAESAPAQAGEREQERASAQEESQLVGAAPF